MEFSWIFPFIPKKYLLWGFYFATLLLFYFISLQTFTGKLLCQSIFSNPLQSKFHKKCFDRVGIEPSAFWSLWNCLIHSAIMLWWIRVDSNQIFPKYFFFENVVCLQVNKITLRPAPHIANIWTFKNVNIWTKASQCIEPKSVMMNFIRTSL